MLDLLLADELPVVLLLLLLLLADELPVVLLLLDGPSVERGKNAVDELMMMASLVDSISLVMIAAVDVPGR
jgi:hypothetical protein